MDRIFQASKKIMCCAKEPRAIRDSCCARIFNTNITTSLPVLFQVAQLCKMLHNQTIVCTIAHLLEKVAQSIHNLNLPFFFFYNLAQFETVKKSK